MLDLYHLKTFYILSQTMSYTETGKKLFLTQSAISHGIKKIENTLGYKLTIKAGNQFVLTEEAELLKISCAKIFTEIEQFEEQIHHKNDAYIYNINIGAPIEFGCNVFIKNMLPFFKKHINFHVNFYFSADLLTSLLKDELDIIIDCRIHKNDNIQKIDLFREEYSVIASPEYLKSNTIKIPKDLENVTILSFDKNLIWWQNFLRTFPEPMIPKFKNIMTINNIRGIINATLLSLGVGFVPKYTVINELKKKSLINLFPKLKLMDDKFYIYQKKIRSSLHKNIVLTEFLKNINPAEFGI